MAQKLWEKNVRVNEEIDRFTVGRDREMDLYLAKHDVLGSMAHITMLESIGLLTAGELEMLLAELKNIYASDSCALAGMAKAMAMAASATTLKYIFFLVFITVVVVYLLVR